MSDDKIILNESETEFSFKLNNINSPYHLITSNNKYIAFNSSSQGEITLTTLEGSSKPIKLLNDDILNLELSPINNEIIAVLTQNNCISIFDLNKYAENENQIQPNCILNHTNEISFMSFNPVKPDILCSCEKDGKIHFWDIISGNIISELNTENNPKGLAWSPNGDLIGICFENGLLNIYKIDNRKNKKIFSEKISEGNINFQNFSWISDNSFVSVGLCKDNEIKLCIWDNFISTEKNILGECKIYSMKINYNNTDIIPFMNRNKKDRILIYLVNKQDILNPSIPPSASITVYEFKDKEIIKKTEYFSTHNASFSILLSDKFFNANNNEIDRFIRYCSEEEKMYYVSIIQEKEGENTMDNQQQLKTSTEQQNRLENDIDRKEKEKEKDKTDLNFSTKSNDIITKSLVSYVEIIPKINTSEVSDKNNEELKNLKIELSEQKKINEDLDKENVELKFFSNEKDKEINEYKEIISNLKKNLEDIKNEKANIIKDQLNILENKKRKIEEEIENLNKVFEIEKYNKKENENNFKPELSIINDEKLKGSTTSDLTEIIKNEQGQQMKLEKIIKKGDGISNNLVTDIPNKNYIFYNLKTVDDKKDIIIANDEEYKIFVPEQNKESQ